MMRTWQMYRESIRFFQHYGQIFILKIVRLAGYFASRRAVIAVTCLSLASSFAVTSDAKDGETFSLRRGINVAGAYVRTLSLQGADGQISGFAGIGKTPPSYTPEELINLSFDFVRVPVNPVPLLENPSAVVGRLLDEVEQGMRPYLSAGLRVVFDLQFWSPPNKVWTPNAIISGDPSAFAVYRAVVREIAQRLARYPDGQVALELFNEPPSSNCELDWIPKQRTLLKDVRDFTQALPVLISGCVGQLDGLLALNGSHIDMTDEKLVYSFHFYEPFLFTHQGGYKDYAYIEGVPYPAFAGQLSTALSVTNQNINKAPLSEADALRENAYAAKEITRYFVQNRDQTFIAGRFDTLIAWAHANGIPASRLFLGEFAAINWRKSDTPNYLQNRQAWDESVQLEAEKRGIAHAYWNLPSPKGPIFR